MQNPNEVYNGQFTPDGRYAVAAVRGSSVHVWDLVTAKLAAPPLHYPLGMVEAPRTFGISRYRVIACGAGFPVIDVSLQLKEPVADTDDLLRRAELASNLKLQLGELATLLQSEWDSRWETFVATRSRP
jgi:hypothetical protein